MKSFAAWAFRESYRKQKSRSRLLQISDLIDWSPIHSILDEMYDNKSEKVGRPNFDVILMFKVLILEWYGLSDPEVEKQISDRVSFMGFLIFPNRSPTRSRYGFSGNLKETGKYDLVWREFQCQLDSKGLNSPHQCYAVKARYSEPKARSCFALLMSSGSFRP